MRRILVAAAAVLAAAGVAAIAAQPASADARRPILRVHEHATDLAQIDLGVTGPSLGDQLIGTAGLTDRTGQPAGRDTFVCTSMSHDGTRFQCSVTYEFPDGRVTAQGNATVTGKGPLFIAVFAITGGTAAYQNARGQVRIEQQSPEDADLTLHIQP